MLFFINGKSQIYLLYRYAVFKSQNLLSIFYNRLICGGQFNHLRGNIIRTPTILYNVDQRKPQAYQFAYHPRDEFPLLLTIATNNRLFTYPLIPYVPITTFHHYTRARTEPTNPRYPNITHGPIGYLNRSTTRDGVLSRR